LRAEILDITKRGEVTIEFSESIKPIHNLTMLERDIIVSLERGRENRSDLISSWEILAVSNM